MVNKNMKSALKSGILVLLGGFTVIAASGFENKLRHSKMGCSARMAILADEVKPLFVLPLKDTDEEAIFAMVAQEKSVIVKLTLTEGNFLFENQCMRSDGKKVLISVQDKLIEN